jgi:hypothetical protein
MNEPKQDSASTPHEVSSRLGDEGWMAVHMADMHRVLLRMEHENRLAAREEGLGGWLSDHAEAMRQYNEDYRAARAKLTGESATGEVSDNARKSLRAAEADLAEVEAVNSDLRTVNARLVADLAAAMERLNHAESIIMQ